jgi:hypothetical protein
LSRLVAGFLCPELGHSDGRNQRAFAPRGYAQYHHYQDVRRHRGLSSSVEQSRQFQERQPSQQLPEPAPLDEQADHCWGSSLHRDGLEQVRHDEQSDFARFDIDVQGRRPDNKSRKHYDRNNGDESQIDKQIVFDHLSLLGFQK